MKMLKLFAVLLALWGITLHPTAAQEKPSRVVWEEQKPNIYFAKIYHFQNAQGSHCFVDVHGDGRDLTIVARTYRNDAFFLEQIDIIREGDSATKTEKKFSTVIQEVEERLVKDFVVVGKITHKLIGPYQEDPLMPDIFTKDFLEAAKALPAEVQELFSGCYKLGNGVCKTSETK